MSTAMKNKLTAIGALGLLHTFSNEKEPIIFEVCKISFNWLSRSSVEWEKCKINQNLFFKNYIECNTLLFSNWKLEIMNYEAQICLPF